MESRLNEEISKAEVFRADYKTLRRERHTRGGGVFICVKNYITCAELWVDAVNEMKAVEVKGRTQKVTWEIVGIYTAPKKVMRVLEIFTWRTGYMGSTTKCSIVGGDLNLPHADLNGHAEKSRGTKVFLNRLLWENSYTQVANSSTRGDALLNVYLFRPGSLFTFFSNVQGISKHYGVLLEVGWGENCREHQVERLVPVHHTTNVPGLKCFLRGKFAPWESFCGSVKEILFPET